MNLLATGKDMTEERQAVTFQIKCAESWLDRVKMAADKKGLAAAAYIRMVVSERMDLDSVPDQKPPARRKGV